MHLRTGPLLICYTALASACITSSSDDVDCSSGKCDIDQTCNDARYGDGTCQEQIDCQVPDIDCFRTFDTDAEAATWFSEFEALSAMQTGGQPRTLLDATDPRFAHVRELADKGWEAFSKARPVGELAKKRPGVVLIDDDTPNAFVAPDISSGKAGFSIQVQTGLLSLNASDDQLLGVMMHELQHAVGLHVVGGTRDRLRKYYAASEYGDPIGRLEDDDPKARELGDPWRLAAEEVGGYDNAELGGLPLAGQIGTLLQFAMGEAAKTNEAGCTASAELLGQFDADLSAAKEVLGGALTMDPGLLSSRVDDIVYSLQYDCFSGVSLSFIDAIAQMVGATPDDIIANTPPEDLALVQGKGVLDGVLAVTESRRAAMRDLEQRFASSFDRNWNKLRYFSIEEDADDISVLVLRDAGLDPAGEAGFMLRFLGDAAATCQELIDNDEVPPYGVDLTDEHHDTCWRAYHMFAWRDASADGPAQTSARIVRRAPTATTTVRRLPIPKRLKDLVVY
jgi:hypothetical protein